MPVLGAPNSRPLILAHTHAAVVGSHAHTNAVHGAHTAPVHTGSHAHRSGRALILPAVAHADGDTVGDLGQVITSL